MGPAAKASITFKAAASAAGVTERQLRNWVDKGQVALKFDEARVGVSWRRFAPLDVLRLAVIGAIVRYNVGVVEASAIVDEGMQDRLLAAATFKNLPAKALESAFLRRKIVITWEADRFEARWLFGASDEQVENDLRHFLTVDVEKIVSDTLSRLDSAGVVADDDAP